MSHYSTAGNVNQDTPPSTRRETSHPISSEADQEEFPEKQTPEQNGAKTEKVGTCSSDCGTLKTLFVPAAQARTSLQTGSSQAS